MVKTRAKETDQGIQGELDISVFDELRRRMRDQNRLDTDEILRRGMNQGHALELGPGPGYLGLEWLKKTSGTTLQGVDISPGMIRLAEKNAGEYALNGRALYVLGDVQAIPFPKETFDIVFSSGSLHEWAEPQLGFDEIHRILKPGGQFYISDLRRDMNPFLVWLLKRSTKPKAILPGFVSSLNAAYTQPEIQSILQESRLGKVSVVANPFSLILAGRKER